MEGHEALTDGGIRISASLGCPRLRVTVSHDGQVTLDLDVWSMHRNAFRKRTNGLCGASAAWQVGQIVRGGQKVGETICTLQAVQHPPVSRDAYGESGNANTKIPLAPIGRRFSGVSCSGIWLVQLAPPVPTGTARYCLPPAA